MKINCSGTNSTDGSCNRLVALFELLVVCFCLFVFLCVGVNSCSCVTRLGQWAWETEEVVDVVWPMGRSFHTRHCFTRHQNSHDVQRQLVCVHYIGPLETTSLSID